jgi:hypothetical protein
VWSDGVPLTSRLILQGLDHGESFSSYPQTSIFVCRWALNGHTHQEDALVIGAIPKLRPRVSLPLDFVPIGGDVGRVAAFVKRGVGVRPSMLGGRR